MALVIVSCSCEDDRSTFFPAYGGNYVNDLITSFGGFGKNSVWSSNGFTDQLELVGDGDQISAGLV